jgi:hypothetical protein
MMDPVGLINEYRAHHLTRDELFAALTEFLAEIPSALGDTRAALSFDRFLRGAWETWLVGLRTAPRILLGDHFVAVSPELLDAIASTITVEIEK